MASPNEVRLDLRETDPLPRNTLHSLEGLGPDNTGERMRTKGQTNGYRDWLHGDTSPKVSADYLLYPADIRDTAKSGMGRSGNHRLSYSAESIVVNVGGPRRNAKASSLLMCDVGVGGVIVL